MAFAPFDPSTDADNSGANSYASAADLHAYAVARGITLVGDDIALETQLTKAMDYLEAQADEYKGYKADDAQPMQWPRCGVFLFSAKLEFDKTKLPPLLLNAQCELACIINSGVSLYPVAVGPFVKSEKVDVIEVVYSEIISTSGLPQIPSVDAILAPLIGDGGIAIRVSRA